MKNGRYVFLALIVLSHLFLRVHSSPIPSCPLSQLPKIEIVPELIFSIGSDSKNVDFFSPKHFSVSEDGTIYVLDSGNSRVQCFSHNGSYLFTFGGFGQGPGEFSKEASKLKILKDGNIYIIDNPLRRISVFSKKGIFIRSFKTDRAYDDISLNDNTYYLTSLILRKDYKPIHYSSDLSKINKSLGYFLEPTPKILQIVSSAPIPALIENEFSYLNMTSVHVNTKGHIFYSQLQPYHILIFDASGRLLAEHKGATEFDTHFPLSISFQGGKTVKRVTGPVPIIYEPIHVDEKTIIVPVISPDRSYFYLDILDENYGLGKRYHIQNIFYDYKQRAGITSIFIDHSNNLYCLINSRDEYPKLSKYKLKGFRKDIDM